MSTTIYEVDERPDGMCVIRRDGIAVERNLPMGLAIQKAFVLSARDGSSRIALVSGGYRYDLAS